MAEGMRRGAAGNGARCGDGGGGGRSAGAGASSSDVLCSSGPAFGGSSDGSHGAGLENGAAAAMLAANGGSRESLDSAGTPHERDKISRFVLSGAVNNPRVGWLEWIGLPEDLDEWTLSEFTGSVNALVRAPAAAAPREPKQQITVVDFKDYLQRVAEPYRFLAANRPATNGTSSGQHTDTHDGEDACGAGATASCSSCTSCSSCSSSCAHAEEAQLEGIPPICFRGDFDLTVPETFETFSPADEGHSTMIMVERLSNYLDQVELKLLTEVSSRAEGFFEALVSYDKLTQEVSAGVATIGAMRAKLRLLETNLVDKSLVLPRLARRRANSEALLEKLRLVHAVWRTQPTIAQLLTSGDFPNALELIASSQSLLATELSGVSSLSQVRASLVETKALIETTMCSTLLRVACGYDSADGIPTDPIEALASELDFHLAPVATGLLRLRALHEPLLTLQELLKKEIRHLAKHKLQEQLALRQAAAEDAAADAAAPSNGDGGGDGGGGGGGSGAAAGGSRSASPAPGGSADDVSKPRPVAAQLKELSVDGFESVMCGLSAPLMVVLRRAAAIHASLVKLMAAAATSGGGDAEAQRGARGEGGGGGGGDDGGGGGGGGEVADESAAEAEADRAYRQQIEEQSAQMRSALCELVHERYAKLLRARKEVHSRLPLAQFVRVNRMVVEFVRDVQHLSGSPGHTLTAEIQAHAKGFMDANFEESTNKLEAIVEMEQWKQVDVAPEFQQIIDALTCNQVPRVKESDLLRLREQHEPAEAAVAAKELVVAGAGYKAVGSALLLLNVLTYCLQCLSSMQSVASQVAHILPALLKKFHKKAYQQVLMAGAMRPESAGLKSINAKHIALSSQALGLVIALLPHLKAILAAYMPEGQRRLLAEMDTAAEDYEEHQSQLFAKLVSILEDRRREHVKNIKEVLAPTDGRRQPEPSANVKAVVKDLASMHKQLQPLLTRAQLHTVFAQILAAFDKGLLEAYSTVDTAPAFSRQCVVQDVHYIRKEVAKLHLSLPNGACPELVAFAQGLPLQ